MTWSITEGAPNYLVLFSMLGWVRDASHFIGGPMLLTFASKLRSRVSSAIPEGVGDTLTGEIRVCPESDVYIHKWQALLHLDP